MEKEKYTEKKNYTLSVLHETVMHETINAEGQKEMQRLEKRQHFGNVSNSQVPSLREEHQKENPSVITAKQAEKNQKKKVKEAQELNKKYKENRFGVINGEIVDMKINTDIWKEKELVGSMTEDATAMIEEQVKEAVRLEEEAKARRKEIYKDRFEELQEEVERCLKSSDNAGDQWSEISSLYNFIKRNPIDKALFMDHFMGTYYQTKKAYENSRSRNKK